MKLVVWDLHGTLEEGSDRAVVDLSNVVLERYGYAERFSYADSGHLSGRKWHEYFQWRLGAGDHERDLALQDACFTLSAENTEFQRRYVRPTPHAPLVLEAVRSAHQQLLISNARPETLRLFIGFLGYGTFFTAGNAFAAGGQASRSPRSKADILAGFLRTAGNYEELLIIGDSPDDMRLRDVAGGITYLFAHPGTEFSDCEADFRIRDLRAILDRL